MFNPSFYIGRNINAEVVSNSASGGIVSLVAEHIIDSGGIVYGATFDASLLSVHHIRITSKDDLGKIRKSKYVWSDIRCILSSIEGDLKGGEQVLFIGTPCQTATLKKRFNTYNNLLILDIFCHGTIQPEIFTQYLKGLNAQIENVDFRHPSESGKHNFVFSIEDKENKKIVHNDYGKDLITSLFISSAGLRSSCFSCLYCNKTHCSCITVGDVEFEELAAKYGYSKYHFSRIFKQYNSMSYIQYINARRTKAAEQLLFEPDIPITEVAMRSGFKSLTTFNRIFKDIKHCTPTDFKKLLEKRTL